MRLAAGSTKRLPLHRGQPAPLAEVLSLLRVLVSEVTLLRPVMTKHILVSRLALKGFVLIIYVFVLSTWHSRIHLWRRNLNWETASIRLACGKSIGHLPDYWLVGRTRPTWVVPLDGFAHGLGKPWRTSQQAVPCHVSASVPASSFVPWAPALASQASFTQGVYHSNRKQTNAAPFSWETQIKIV